MKRRNLLTASAAMAVALGQHSQLAFAQGNGAADKPAQQTGPIPMRRLNNGVEMPMLGFGAYRVIDNAVAIMETALRSGYRLVDTAAYYGNEQQLGEAIVRSEVPRAELFISTKLWIADYGYDEALRAFDASLEKLGLDYVDMYLLHYPTPRYFESTVAAYRAMERLLKEGRIRAIGVSNFEVEHLRRLSEQTEVVPAINQIELHPYFSRQAQREAHSSLDIATQAWSPIGGIFINHPRTPGQIVRVLEDPALDHIAAKYGKTPAQVVLRWHLQNGVIVIPKTNHAYRMKQNLAVFDFELDAADLRAINDLNRDLRGGGNPETFDMDYMRERARRS